MNVTLARGAATSNPYVGPGLAGVPETLLRSMPTPQLLAMAIRESMILRAMGPDDISNASHVPVHEVERLANKGIGSLKAARRVLDALSIRAVSLPPLSTFEAVETHEDAARLV